jgi:hypothetical protein
MKMSVHPNPPRLKLIAAFASVYLIWGSTYLAIRIAIETIPPLLMAGFGFIIAGSRQQVTRQLQVIPGVVKRINAARTEGQAIMPPVRILQVVRLK